MTLSTLDWIVFGGFLILIIGIGLSYGRKAGKNLESFFVGGRNLPWYIAGLSMVATTFAADTPLAVAEIVGNNGIAGNWLWWNFLAGGMLTTFFFARLWRRSGVLTEVELVELRYGGRAAKWLRMFKAWYLGVLMNVVVIAWVNVALITLLEVFFEVPYSTAVMITGVVMLLTAGYAAISGLLGVAMTDVIQFFIAMTGCIILAVIVINLPEVGGVTGMKTQLQTISPSSLDFLPTLDTGGSTGRTLALGLGAFFAYAGLQWWSSWYPGAEPGGGGYVAQRIMSTRNEKESVWATLLFQVMHYCIRPWPWIIVGLCAIILYSPMTQLPEEQKSDYAAVKEITDYSPSLLFGRADSLTANLVRDGFPQPVLQRAIRMNGKVTELASQNQRIKSATEYEIKNGKGFVFAMRDYLPAGLKGLLLVAFFAAYMSTISTQLNWGSSYLINDWYKRNINTKASDKHYVWAGRFATIGLMILGLITSLYVDSISGAWKFLMQCGAGLGLVLILRWYWWRINVWSEISAMIAPVICTAVFYFLGVDFPDAFIWTVGITTLTWLLVTFVTKPENNSVLKQFYDKVHPGGAWGSIAQQSKKKGQPVGMLLLTWLMSIAMTYSILFGFGKLILLEFSIAIPLFIIAFISGAALVFLMNRTEVFNNKK